MTGSQNGILLGLVTTEIERIAGAKLTPDDRENIASAVIKIIQDQNKTAALAAIQVASNVLEDPELNKPEDLSKAGLGLG